MPDRPPAGKVEVATRHNGATDTHTFTCTNAAVSMIRTEGREEAGLKVALVDGSDAGGKPVLDAIFSTFAWVLVRPPDGGSGS